MRIFILLFFFWAIPAFAQTPDASLATDPALENRAREIGQSLRCVVCQNQSIDESDAPLAQDMRKLVRERLKAGDSNEEIINFMREKYGDFVLLKPPVQSNTYLLWTLPFVLLFGGLIWFIRAGRRPA
ncbi:cytochrome c-type biogenesis protein CcmH [Litorimonas sp.]|uniref:cytochrome c-type biogenesis protein n=1 Tax=Litorimonas sp. TaxID=1892381 RepID=UPI003A8B867A